MPRGELADPCVLNAVRILILIYMQVLPLCSISLSDCWSLLQQSQPFNQKIIKVEGFKSLELRGVSSREPSNEPLMMRDGLVLHLIRGEAVVLRTADCAQDQTRLRGACCGEIILLEEPFDHARLIICVIDCKLSRQTDRFAITAQHAHAEAMEGAHRYVARAFTDHLLKACTHLCRRLVGERHRQDAPWGDPLVFNEPGDPVRDDACLPRARASENKERAGGGRYRPPLDLIEWTEDALLERGLARPFGDAVACRGGLERGVCRWIRGEVHPLILPPSTSQPRICSGAE